MPKKDQGAKKRTRVQKKDEGAKKGPGYQKRTSAPKKERKRADFLAHSHLGFLLSSHHVFLNYQIVKPRIWTLMIQTFPHSALYAVIL